MRLGNKYGRFSNTCSRGLQGKQFPQGEQEDRAPFGEEVVQKAEDNGSFDYRGKKMWEGLLKRKAERRASIERKSSEAMKISRAPLLWDGPDVCQDYQTFTTISGPRDLLSSWSGSLYSPLHRQHEALAITHAEHLRIGSFFRPEGIGKLGACPQKAQSRGAQASYVS